MLRAAHFGPSVCPRNHGGPKDRYRQEGVPQASGPTGFDSFLLLVAPRDTITIKKSLQRAATEAEALAETRREQAETMRLGALSRIESKKVEIGRLKERTNAAKKENRDADRLGLEAERKAAEREIELIEGAGGAAACGDRSWRLPGPTWHH